MSTYTDKEIVCRCGKVFTWTAGEQRFMQTLLDNGKIQHLAPPRRCRECVQKKKLRNLK